MKKLYKSEKDSIIWGIIGGIGEYFDVDPTVLRLGFILIVLITGVFPGIIAYIIAYFIIPEKPENSTQSTVDSRQKDTEAKTEAETKTEPKTESKTEPEVKADGYAHPLPMTEPEVTITTEQIPDEPIGELKKPNWPTINSIQSTVNSHQKEEASPDTVTTGEIEYPETEPDTATLDSLLEDENDIDLSDLIDDRE